VIEILGDEVLWMGFKALSVTVVGRVGLQE
jgi:hypothetical protein